MFRNIAQAWKTLFGTLPSSKLPTTSTWLKPVSVRSVSEEEYLQIAFSFNIKNKRPKQFVIPYALKIEDIDITLNKIAKKVNNYIVQKTKNKEICESIDVRVFLVDGNNGTIHNVSSVEAFTRGRILEIDSTKYEVLLNPPTIISLKLKEQIFSGNPICPAIQTEFADFEKCQYVWYRSSEPSKSANTNIKFIKWIEVGKNYYYTPNDADIGFKLKVVCTPCDGKRYGIKEECISKYEVVQGPGYVPFTKRHTHTVKTTGKNSLRVVSYNILAERYSRTRKSADVLFRHCPAHALSMDYRSHLIFSELSGYNADLICLQEVGSKFFQRKLYSYFEDRGFAGLMLEKIFNIEEGVATFFRKSKLRLIDKHQVTLKEHLINDEYHKELWENISQNETVREIMETTPAVLQITLLQSMVHSNRYVMVGCTHLYSHPSGTLIRLFQTWACVTYLQKLKTLYKEQGKEVSVILCGDLNSVPFSGAIDLLRYGKVAATHADWLIGQVESRVNPIELKHNLQLVSACGYPDYTCYTPSFRRCIDYIFIDNNKFKVSKVVPMPCHEDIVEHTALPNIKFPSDHISLACDIEWK